MSEYYNIVPWYNTDEWYKVYKLIYSSDTEDKKKALNHLATWKARCPSLPSGVESTITLLEMNIEDIINPNTNAQLLCLAYSSAIMRFINHMMDTETAKGSSLYQAAKNLGVPDWIVDLRHDTAHSNKLPSIELLREAGKFGLEWLQNNYWEKHKVHMKDYVTGNINVNHNEEARILALMNFCISLSICNRNKIKNIAEIPDSDLKESIVNDANNLLEDQIDFSNLKTVSVMALINSINHSSKKLLGGNCTGAYVPKALLQGESLFLSLDLLYHISANEFREKNSLNRHYVQCFEVLLTFLHTNDLLLGFILELIKITHKNNNDIEKRKLAALWVSEILISLQKSKKFIEKIKKSGSSDKNLKKRKELRQLYHHWFPNEKLYGLLLDLNQPIPKELTDINFVQPIISTYNPFLTYFIKDILNLLEPPMPTYCFVNICNLAKVIAYSENLSKSAVNHKVYTIEDLKNNRSVVTYMEQKSDGDSDCMEIGDDSLEMYVSQNNSKPQVVENNVWQLASEVNNWHSLPIGFRL